MVFTSCGGGVCRRCRGGAVPSTGAPPASVAGVLLWCVLAARGAEWPHRPRLSMSEMAFYEKVVKVKADVAAFLINCFPSA